MSFDHSENMEPEPKYFGVLFVIGVIVGAILLWGQFKGIIIGIANLFV